MLDEAVSADEIIARFKALHSELSKLKRRKLLLKLRLTRIYFLQFLFSLIRPKVKNGFNIFDYFRKFIGHDRLSDRPIRTADLRFVGFSTKKPSEGDQT